MESYESAWPERAATAFVALFVLLFLLTVALPHSWIPGPAKLLAAPFDRFAAFTAKHLLHQAFDGRDESDSAGMLAHVMNLAILSALLALAAVPLLKRPPVALFIRQWLPVLCAVVLGWQLLHYGFNKVFKWQFYRPEPNIQYSRIVDLHRDILYWSTMGTSRGYGIFLGSVELLAAALLFFRRTRLAGALLAIGILANVLAVNFGFDITVKILSAFLMLLAFISIWPDRRRLAALFGASAPVTNVRPLTRKRLLVKCLVIGILLSDALYPYFASGNFNDDIAPRQLLHGAYRILDNSPQKQGWERLFIHRHGYFILQDTAERFCDYELNTDPVNRILWVSTAYDSLEYALDYDLRNGLLLIKGKIGGDSLDIRLERLLLRY